MDKILKLFIKLGFFIFFVYLSGTGIKGRKKKEAICVFFFHFLSRNKFDFQKCYFILLKIFF